MNFVLVETIITVKEIVSAEGPQQLSSRLVVLVINNSNDFGPPSNVAKENKQRHGIFNDKSHNLWLAVANCVMSFQIEYSGVRVMKHKSE